MSRFLPELRPLAPASLPLTDPARAWSVILEHTPEVPGWPRLPRRSFLENPTIQVCEGFPGIIFENDTIYVDDVWERDTLLDKLYIAYLGDDVEHGRIGVEYAACLGRLLAEEGPAWPETVRAVKGQLVGPLSWALQVLDQDGSPILYNENLLDIVAKHLRLKAGWQAQILHRSGVASIVLIEEPLLTSLGLASLPIETERALGLVQDVLEGVPGLKGIHCTYPVDARVFDLPANILSLDVSHSAEPSANGLEALREFVKRGGILVWAIVPADDRIDDTPLEMLADRVRTWLECLAPEEDERRHLVAASLLSTSDGLGGLSEARAELALAVLSALSRTVRSDYGL